MALDPRFGEHLRRRAFGEGIHRCDELRRCDELLVKSPQDVSLLITKVRILCATSQPPERDDGRQEILEQLASTRPPIQDLGDLDAIETAVVDSLKNTFPPPRSAGPAVARLWDVAFHANADPEYRHDLLTMRFVRAVVDSRVQDAQHALLQLKAVVAVPKNRAIYMAHAAYTQLLSTAKDDLQSKLAMGLARKAVGESFDHDTALDCRVVGQIFAIQNSRADLESIKTRPAFAQSKQVYEALQLHKQPECTDGGSGGGAEGGGAEVVDPAKPSPPPPPPSPPRPRPPPSPREWLQSEVDKLKREFAGLMEAAGTSTEVLTQFVANSIRLLCTATTSLNLGARNRVAADPCFLAVSGLVKLFSENDDQIYLLQAAYLTERLLAYNQHVHEARLVLVYIYMRLGLGANAICLFDSLNIKEVQFDTVGHTLFTRLTTIHPLRTLVPGKDWYEPRERSNRALQMYPRHEEKLANCECGILAHAQSGMIFDLNQLRSELRHSWSRRMFLLEHRKTSRLSGKGYRKGSSEIGARLLANWTRVTDNRDFNAAFDYGFNVEKALYGRNGRLPGETWTLANLAADVAWSLADEQTALVLDVDNLQSALHAAISSSSSEPNELTRAEILSSNIVLELLPVLQILQSGSPPSQDSIEAISTRVKQLPISSLVASEDPLAEHIADHYVFLDTMLIVCRACKYIADTAGHLPPGVATLHQAALNTITLLQTHATKQAAALSHPNVLERMLKDDVIGKELQTFGRETLDDFAQRHVASAREGWDGVGMLALPA